MSQNLLDSLEEMAIWDEEMCQQNVDKSLPKILSRFEDSTFINEGINLLQLICKSFVPIVPTEEIEDKVFSRICKMICSLLKDVVNKVQLNVKGALKDTAEELKETITECLQWVVIIVDCVEKCVKQMLSVREALDLSYIKSLPSCAVTILNYAYCHCKESTDLYGDLLDDVGESLSNLFKKAHCLQTALLSLLDKLAISRHYEEHVQVLCAVCSGLFDVCKVVSSLDIKLVVSLWKAISRICSQNLELMRDRFDVCPLISYLCQEIIGGYNYLFQLCPASDPESLSQGDDKAFSKWVKIVGFQMKVLVALLRDFSDYLGSCEKDVVELLLSLHRSLPPCLGVAQISESQEGDICSQIISATLPILNHLISSRAFRVQLTLFSEERKPEDYFPLLLLQLMVLDLLPKCDGDVIDYWLKPVNHNTENPSKPLVEAIFDSVRLCFIEMRVPVMMPGIMVAGKAQRPVSLYEHVVVHLCGFVGSCLSRHFAVVESTLLDNVLGQNDLSCLLATDVWCFMARYGTATLCYHHVQCLVQLYLTLKRKNKGTHMKPIGNVTQLIKRLIKFLSPPQQISLTELYPPEKNIDLWITLTLAPFCDQVQQVVGKSLTAQIKKVFSGHETRLSVLFQTISCIKQIITDQSMIDVCLSPPQKTLMITGVQQLWNSLLVSPSVFGQGKESIMVELLLLTRLLIPVLMMSDILQVTEILSNLLNEKCSSRFLLSCCHFVGDVILSVDSSTDPENSPMINFADITHHLLTHTDPVVQSTSLSIVAAMATDAQYKTFVPLCVKDEDIVYKRLDNLLQQIPFGAENFSVEDYLQSQHSAVQMNDNNTHDNAKSSTEAHKEQETSSNPNFDELKDSMETQDPTKLSCVDTDKKEASDCVTDENPPAKKPKLQSSHEEEHDKINQDGNITDSSQANQWQVILDNMKKVASDLEQKCSNTSPPEWFIYAANVSLAQINDCLTVKASWFDSLS